MGSGGQALTPTPRAPRRQQAWKGGVLSQHQLWLSAEQRPVPSPGHELLPKQVSRWRFTAAHFQAVVFPVAALTNRHKFGGLNNRNVFSIVVAVRSPTPRCRQGRAPPGGSGGGGFLPLPGPGGCLFSSASGPFPPISASTVTSHSALCVCLSRIRTLVMAFRGNPG